MMWRMTVFKSFALLALLAAAIGLARPAAAHPHVWIDARAEVVFDGNGRVIAIRHVWTFDEAYSAFATTGLDANRDGRFSREELADLAKVNVESLEEFEYFTFLKSAGRKVKLGKPVDYWLEHADSKLTFHFTLPLARPAEGRTVSLEIADPTYFVSFEFAAGETVRLSAAPAGCTVSLRRPARIIDQAEAARLGESLLESLRQSASPFGDQFTNRAIVACP
jgi:ABC-type uncharacterized transport system substrate-binding protein